MLQEMLHSFPHIKRVQLAKLHHTLEPFLYWCVRTLRSCARALAHGEVCLPVTHAYPAYELVPPLVSHAKQRNIIRVSLLCLPRACPYGPAAQQLLHVVQRELSSPGSALRRSYLGECSSGHGRWPRCCRLAVRC